MQERPRAPDPVELYWLVPSQLSDPPLVNRRPRDPAHPMGVEPELRFVSVVACALPDEVPITALF